jgi:hypothetical protein
MINKLNRKINQYSIKSRTYSLLNLPIINLLLTIIKINYKIEHKVDHKQLKEGK